MNNCTNPSTPFNVRIVLPEKDPDAPEEQGEVEVRGVSPIKVVKRMEGLKTVFLVSYSPPKPPSCSITVTPTQVEVGQSQSFTFNVSDTEGSSPVIKRTVTPNTPIVNGQFTKTLTFMAAGQQGVHKYEIEDEEGQKCESSAGINVVYRFYKGTIARTVNTLDINTITAMVSQLGSSIGAAFPRQEYTMDRAPQGHFIWVYPADFSSIPTPTGDGNFPFQLTVLEGSWTINGVVYKAAKTSTYFTNGGKATLGF
jgi:hypothetical protein